mmetsp:Transcript_16514/g.44727  ORF Transcript_16514/g.44727 Transcript_16514/m.44727 type:complete len:205 (+) Transcript_16514:189-803(+)
MVRVAEGRVRDLRCGEQKLAIREEFLRGETQGVSIYTSCPENKLSVRLQSIRGETKTGSIFADCGHDQLSVRSQLWRRILQPFRVHGHKLEDHSTVSGDVVGGCRGRNDVEPGHGQDDFWVIAQFSGCEAESLACLLNSRTDHLQITAQGLRSVQQRPTTLGDGRHNHLPITSKICRRTPKCHAMFPHLLENLFAGSHGTKARD